MKFTDLVSLGTIVSEVSKGQARLDTEAKRFRTYAGQNSNCDACIKMPGAYDIGLLKEKDHYVPIMESALNWGSVLGVNNAPLGLVQQEYALREAEYEAAQRGMACERVSGENGRITLRMTVAA